MPVYSFMYRPLSSTRGRDLRKCTQQRKVRKILPARVTTPKPPCAGCQALRRQRVLLHKPAMARGRSLMQQAKSSITTNKPTKSILKQSEFSGSTPTRCKPNARLIHCTSAPSHQLCWCTLRQRRSRQDAMIHNRFHVLQLAIRRRNCFLLSLGCREQTQI